MALDVAQGKLSSPLRTRLANKKTTGDKFRELAQAYIIKGLERGVPSLFVDVKSIYSDQEKMVIVGEIVEGIIQKLEKDSTLSNDGMFYFIHKEKRII